MCWLFSGPAELSYLKGLIHPQQESSSCGDERVLVWCLGKAPCAGLRKQSSEDGHMETKAKVQNRAWGPVHFNLLSLGTLSESLSGDSCSLVSESPSLSRVAYTIDGLRGPELFPNL